MGKFFLDMEFTNGSYYLTDIIEMALVAEESGNAFHSHIRIHLSIPKRVRGLTNITNRTWNLYIMITEYNCRVRQIQLSSHAVAIHMIFQSYSPTV